MTNDEFFTMLRNLFAFVLNVLALPFYAAWSALGGIYAVFFIRDGSFDLAFPDELDWSWPKAPPKKKKK